MRKCYKKKIAKVFDQIIYQINHHLIQQCYTSNAYETLYDILATVFILILSKICTGRMHF
jgi:hypothetical protein